MLTHDNDNFPSDVFTMMAAAGATLTIGPSGGHTQPLRVRSMLEEQAVTSPDSLAELYGDSGIFFLYSFPFHPPPLFSFLTSIASFPVRLCPSFNVSVGLPEAGHDQLSEGECNY